MVRSASISFSMNQIRKANKLASLAPHLNDLWERSTYVAAYAYVLARTCTRVNPDEAMLTGMMHGIGKLYILTRATGHPELFASEDVLNDIINDWYPSIGKAILENWKFSESMARAVGQEDFSRTDLDSPDLTDVVGIAMLMVAYGTDIAGLEQTLQELPAAKRLGMDQSKTLSVMQDSAAEVTALSQALGN
jgi:HD-like signal output (HDOD) protein